MLHLHYLSNQLRQNVDIPVCTRASPTLSAYSTETKCRHTRMYTCFTYVLHYLPIQLRHNIDIYPYVHVLHLHYLPNQPTQNVDIPVCTYCIYVRVYSLLYVFILYNEYTLYSILCIVSNNVAVQSSPFL